jgi:enamine deaminase RidA (YjgF/YER057c/UK114 family)
MYFLNGDRTYIKPENGCNGLSLQLQNCLEQLGKINSGKRIFKLNFFVDTNSNSEYDKLLKDVRIQVKERFGSEILISFISQAPLSCKVIVEAYYYDPESWDCQMLSEGENSTALFLNGTTEILLGTVHANQNSNCKLNAEKAFDELVETFEEAQFPLNSIVRQWNYLEDILGFDGEEQRYQEFNNVRSDAYGKVFEQGGYPAATGIGMTHGGVLIEYVAVKSKEVLTQPVDNPDQVSAHQYTDQVLVGEACNLKTTPKFERARYLRYRNKKLIFISGTASIIGENTVGVGDAAKQTEVTIQNMQRLYADEVLAALPDEVAHPEFGHTRVYVKNRTDYTKIRDVVKKFYGDLPVVYILADICRDDLLVEIEGKVILQ